MWSVRHRRGLRPQGSEPSCVPARGTHRRPLTPRPEPQGRRAARRSSTRWWDTSVPLGFRSPRRSNGDSVAWSWGPTTFSRLAAWSRTKSRMLRSFRIRARRTAGSVLPLAPNKRSNTARGLFSIGSGVVGVRQAIVLRYARVTPPSQVEPANPGSSIPSSSEASCVSFANSLAAIWSIETAARAVPLVLNATPVKKWTGRLRAITPRSRSARLGSRIPM